jgi:parallel beta-helix repeat protein
MEMGAFKMISMKKMILTSTFLIAAVFVLLFSSTLAFATSSVEIWSMSDTTLQYCSPIVVANSTNKATIRGALIDLDTAQRVYIMWYDNNIPQFDYYLTLDSSPYFDTKFPNDASTVNIEQYNEVGQHIIKVEVKDETGTVLASDEKSYEVVSCETESLTLGPPSSQCLGMTPDNIPGTYVGGDIVHASITDELGATSSFNLPAGSFNLVDVSTQMIESIYATAGFHYLRLDVPVHSESSVLVSSTVPFNIQPCGYYVDINEGNDDNAGTAAAPWKTLHYSLSTIRSGTLNVAAGTYNVANGEANSAITISSNNLIIVGEGDAAIGASDPTAVVDGTGGGGSTEWNTGFKITGSKVTIKGISIKNFSTTSESGIEISGGTGNEVVNCKISNNDTGVEITNSSAFKIQFCEIYENTTDGLNVTTSTDGEIYRNTIYRHQGSGDDGVAVFGCSPAIKRNKIYDNYTGIRVEANSTASPDIRNNVIYETEDYTMNYGILVRANDNSTASPTIYHNSIDGGSGDGIATEYVSTSGTLTPDIKYNIITRCDVHGIDAVANTCTINYNDIWHNGPNGRGLATDNYNGCNPGANDLTAGDGLGKDPENGTAGPLASTSPCVDAIPTNVGDNTTMDYLGYKRPKGSGYDMGAYEYIATQTYSDTLPGGTGLVTDYDIFTLPLDIGTGQNMLDKMEATLGSYNQATWRVFSHTTNGDVEMNTQAFASLDIKPGLGLWGITTLTNTITYSGTLAPDAIYYKMKLSPGWHLFGVPWKNTSINLGKIYVTDGVNQYVITDTSNTLTQQKIWDYTGTGPTNGYVERNTDNFSLTDGVGFFIKVLGSANIILSIPPDNDSDPPNNSSSSSSLATNNGSPESVRLSDDSEPPPLPGGSYGPMPDIRANGKSGPLTVSKETPVSITVSLDPGDQAGENADWWVVAHTPFDTPLNWYSYVYPEGWRYGIFPCVQTPLYQVPPSFEVLNMALPPGDYTFYFAIDENADGIVDETWKDSVEVRVE